MCEAVQLGDKGTWGTLGTEDGPVDGAAWAALGGCILVALYFLVPPEKLEIQAYGFNGKSPDCYVVHNFY